VLSLLYGSIFNDGPMKNLVCFTTPIDFREMKLFQNFSDRRYFDVDKLVDSVGNVPPEMILASFDMLRPSAKVMGQVQLWENIWNDEFVKSYRMFDRWANDTLPLMAPCRWADALRTFRRSRCRSCMRSPSTITLCLMMPPST
jgi:polyhydroxyalkanoate synthase